MSMPRKVCRKASYRHRFQATNSMIKSLVFIRPMVAVVFLPALRSARYPLPPLNELERQKHISTIGLQGILYLI